MCSQDDAGSGDWHEDTAAGVEVKSGYTDRV